MVYYEAASTPKQIAWYDDLHGMTSTAVRRARETRLAEQLDLNPRRCASLFRQGLRSSKQS